jgi:hypothetical protein
MDEGLAGRWAVRRTVIDFLTGARHRFEGTAVITASAFTEQGLLRFGVREMPASRSYRLEPGETATRVLHADGREFIALEAKAAQSVRHQCGADLYAGRFFFRGDEWAEVWRVRGPRKNYASFGRFRRVAVS